MWIPEMPIRKWESEESLALMVGHFTFSLVSGKRVLTSQELLRARPTSWEHMFHGHSFHGDQARKTLIPGTLFPKDGPQSRPPSLCPLTTALWACRWRRCNGVLQAEDYRKWKLLLTWIFFCFCLIILEITFLPFIFIFCMTKYSKPFFGN